MIPQNFLFDFAILESSKCLLPNSTPILGKSSMQPSAISLFFGRPVVPKFLQNTKCPWQKLCPNLKTKLLTIFISKQLGRYLKKLIKNININKTFYLHVIYFLFLPVIASSKTEYLKFS